MCAEYNSKETFFFVSSYQEVQYCGGTGIYTKVPTNTIQVPITTGTVTDSGSVYTGLLGAISRYIYRTSKL